MIFSMEFCRFCTETPIFVTSCGSLPSAWEMRFFTLINAISGSVPWSKVMVIEALPVFVAEEVIYDISSTPLMASSNGTMTLFSTASELAPV